MLRNLKHRPPEDHSHTRIILKIAYTILCTFTPLFYFVLFCLLVSHSRSLSVSVQDFPHPAIKRLAKQKHVCHWEDLETWLSVATDRILHKVLNHSNTGPAGWEHNKAHGTRPKSKLQSQRISQDPWLLKSHTHRHPQVEWQACCTTPAGADTCTKTHHAASTGSSGATRRD